jgi:formate/nitrite transporter FocA (FNT family)
LAAKEAGVSQIAESPPAGPDRPARQYLSAEHVVAEMAGHGTRRLQRLSVVQILVLAMQAGGFVTVGALFSVLLAVGVGSPGAERLIEGLGFSAGFFFVILSDAVLFTEANVVLPATILRCHSSPAARLATIARFWALAWAGNLAGAFLVGYAIHLAQHYPADVTGLLTKVVARKMAYRAIGGVGAWWQVVLSGMLANWLVGMAAFFAVMGRTIIGKYIPVFLAVTLFVAANFQHSPANMGYFSLIMPTGHGPGWGAALAWNIIPAGVGNMAGGALLVALPFWYALGRSRRPALAAAGPGRRTASGAADGALR